MSTAWVLRAEDGSRTPRECSRVMKWLRRSSLLRWLPESPGVARPPRVSPHGPPHGTDSSQSTTHPGTQGGPCIARSASLLTLDEVADVLHVSTRTVGRLVAAGDLPAVRVGR